MKKLLYVLAVILIAAGLQGYAETGPSEPKPVDLADMVSLRTLPGADGCEPGSYRPPVTFKGENGSDTCVDTTAWF